MGLNHFNVDKDDLAFFRDAANKIYDWLPPDKKIKLHIELASEGLSNIEELAENERFFRLLHFLEVNYIKVVDWTEQTIQRLKRFDEAHEITNIKDIEIELAERETFSLHKISNELLESKITDLFYSTLDSLELGKEYKYYLLRRREVMRHE